MLGRRRLRIRSRGDTIGSDEDVGGRRLIGDELRHRRSLPDLVPAPELWREVIVVVPYDRNDARRRSLHGAPSIDIDCAEDAIAPHKHNLIEEIGERFDQTPLVGVHLLA